MKHAALIAVSVIALSLGACGKKNEPAAEATTAADAAGPVAPDAAVPSPAQAFANAAAASDAFEIETSKLAAEKGASAKVKSFAASMVKAHTESTAKLKAAAAAATPSVVPDARLTPMQQATLDELRTKSGADFDAAYTKAQIDAHQMTLDTLKAYSASGDVASLKSFATELVPIVTAHLNMAKGL